MRVKKYAFTFSVQQSFQQPILKHSFLVRCMPGTYPFQALLMPTARIPIQR